MVVLFNRDIPLHDKREMRLSRMVSYTRKLHIFVITLIAERERERYRLSSFTFFIYPFCTYVLLFIFIILDFYLQICLYIGFDYLDFRFFLDSFDCLFAFLICL